jgi:hypothetical protein
MECIRADIEPPLRGPARHGKDYGKMLNDALRIAGDRQP